MSLWYPPPLLHVIKQYIWGDWDYESINVIEDVILYNKNVFLTGEAGTGKTYLARHIIHLLDQQQDNNEDVSVEVTAMSGISSINLEGRTLHSAFSLGRKPDVANPKLFYKHMTKYQKAKWQSTQVLVIDEIGTASASLFEFLHEIATLARQNFGSVRSGRPYQINKKRKRNNENETSINWVFGGIQLFCIGDFFQLAPIFERNEKDKRFLFESPLFATAFSGQQGKFHELTKIHRQINPEFITLLQHVRYGISNSFVLEQLEQLSKPCLLLENNENNIIPTQLFPLKKQVSEVNEKHLQNLNTAVHIFHAETYGIHGPELLASRGMESVLQLKIGAQVIHLINQPSLNIWNGSRGVVIDVVDTEAAGLCPVVCFLGSGAIHTIEPYKVEPPRRIGKTQNKKQNSWAKQIPLNLAWALSIHKSQSLTIDLLELDLKHAFDPAQTYVGLSRGKHLHSIHLLHVEKIKLRPPHPKILAFAKKWLKPCSLLTLALALNVNNHYKPLYGKNGILQKAIIKKKNSSSVVIDSKIKKYLANNKTTNKKNH